MERVGGYLLQAAMHPVTKVRLSLAQKEMQTQCTSARSEQGIEDAFASLGLVSKPKDNFVGLYIGLSIEAVNSK